MWTTLVLLRIGVLTVAGSVCLVALGAMAVQRRLINPFGPLAGTVRRLSDPLLEPIERRLLRSGGNPRSAPGWLAATALMGGILVITVAQWLIAQAWRLWLASGSGARGLWYILVDWMFGLLMIALLVRVIGSWVGLTQYTRWMRPFYFLTEWFLAPLRRVLPPFGPFDISPLLAWLALSLLRGAILR